MSLEFRLSWSCSRRPVQSFVCIILALSFTPKLAANVLATSYNTGSTSGGDTSKGSIIAQQFILNSADVVNSVDLALEGPGGITLATNVTLKILNDSSDAPGTQVPGAIDTGVTGTLSGSFSDILFSFNPITLPAGTYWLELSNSANPKLTWQLQSSLQTNSSATGRITNIVYITSTTTGTPSLLATVNGTTAVPEPSTMMISLLALAILGRGVGTRKPV